jgi:hypothetical protein
MIFYCLAVSYVCTQVFLQLFSCRHCLGPQNTIEDVQTSTYSRYIKNLGNLGTFANYFHFHNNILLPQKLEQILFLFSVLIMEMFINHFINMKIVDKLTKGFVDNIYCTRTPCRGYVKSLVKYPECSKEDVLFVQKN